MTIKDKSKRPAGKPSDRSGKPLTRKSAGADRKPEQKAAKGAAQPSADEAMKPERISKLLARAGVASRRDVERMIMEGRVSLNGKVLDTPVVNATLSDRIEVDGEAIRGIERTRLWLYHKPAGLVTTNSDPEGRPTVFDNLPEDLPRVMSIGRLDINTEGLLLLTNDGGLARVLELPTTGWLRRYRVRAHGEIDQAALDKLKEGIAVDGVLYGSIDATLDRTQGHNQWITMGLREGKNREIKNVLGALGLDVNRLIRISYGPFQLGDLPEGKVVEVRGRMLRDQLGPRLIEDAKANFDAPVYEHGSSDEDEAPARQKAQKSDWAREESPRGEGRREDRRERALDRLDTRRDEARGKPQGRRDGGKRGFGDRPERDEGRGAERPKRPPAAKSRTTNVWMAPGARPVAEKKAVEGADAERQPHARREGAPASKRYGRDKDGKPTKALTRFDPDRKGGSDFARREAGPRVQISRARDEEGEWIRAEGPDRSSKDRGEGFGAKRGGDRPARGERSERPARADARAYGDRPRFDRSREDRPRDDRPRGERPFGDKPRSADSRPAVDRPFGGKPKGAKPFGAKAGARSADRAAAPGGFSGKPRGDRPGGKGPGGKSPGGKSFGGRPSGGKPSGGRGPARGKR
ncbi:pseudouridine synthase [Rhizobium cremeum]|uniref:pseudouridine synthase n=1 Tax=Rhizobium cremeum TaxID=2813827 RepID=UPI001FD3D4FD|nr:pseudouridine synthase [Rhizobium cremeum]MCJ7996958.1 pseudouridine synthase [Rhizobium cremeum]MCJ8002176.1 pseudouridine synthase [Rhizobium cremeum]